jgi:hypothetical protein
MKHKSIHNSQFSILNLEVAVIISVLFLFAFASAHAEVLPETARLVPAETILLLNIENFSELKKQFEETNFYKLYKDPTMAAFVEDFTTKWRQKMREMDNEIVRTIVDAEVLPQGRLAVALVSGEQSKDVREPPFLLITQWGENVSKIKEAIDKMVEKAVEDGAHRKSEDYRGVSIKTIIEEDSSVLSYCFIDDCLIVSMNLEAVKFVIAQTEGSSSPTLADDVDYAATIGAIGPYHDIDFYVNIKQITKTALAEDTTGKTQTTIANLSLDNAAAFGASIGLSRRPGSSYCGKAYLMVNGAKKGVFKMLDVESGVLRAPRFIPSSAYSISFLNLNIRGAYDELYNILYNSNPAMAAQMLTPLLPPSPDGQPGLELKSDIIAHLGSQIVIAQSTRKPFSRNSAPTESLIAVAVVNRRAVEKSLSLLHSKVIAPNNPDARRELLGYTIYLVRLPGLPFFPTGRTPMQVPAGPGVPQMPTWAFTITDTHLIFGTESTVERAIRRLSSTEAESVGSAKWFEEATFPIPSVVGLAYLEDNAASSELLWWMMEETAKIMGSGSSGSMGLSMGISMPPDASLIFSQTGLFNAGLLPEFDAVRKYFGLFAFYGISRPDGFFFEFKYLNPGGTD